MPAVKDTAGDLELRLTHPTLLAFYDYWRSLPAERGLPGRQHVDPWAIRALLPWLFMLDVETPPPRASFRWRLAGTGIVDLTGRELTGRTLLQTLPERAASLDNHFSAVVSGRRPSYHRCALPPADGREPRAVERLTCPLAKNGRTVNMLIGVFCPAHSDARQSAA
jgi:hypothetical protein